MAKLRHLAILTHQPDKLADFYKRVFEMHEMYRTKNGSVHLSDGEVNLAILNATDPKEPSAFTSKTTKRPPDAFRKSIQRAPQKSARPVMPRGVDRIPTATFSISPLWAGVGSGEWTSSRDSFTARYLS